MIIHYFFEKKSKTFTFSSSHLRKGKGLANNEIVANKAGASCAHCDDFVVKATPPYHKTGV
jgi:hypothetical protein